jgi:protease I
MARIGVLIDNMFEDSEYSKPAAAYKKAKHELVNIGVKKGTVKGETMDKLKERYPPETS